MEETRYPYYNDNLDLVGYTSELRHENGKFFAFVDFTLDDDIGHVRLCPHCLEYDLKHTLGPKLLKQNERPAPDHDQWLQCWECGRVYPIHQTFTDSKIKDSVETTDNHFNNESTFLSTETRKEQRRKGKKRKGRFSHKQEHQDPDIQREIDRHGPDNVHIIQ